MWARSIMHGRSRMFGDETTPYLLKLARMAEQIVSENNEVRLDDLREFKKNFKVSALRLV